MTPPLWCEYTKKAKFTFKRKLVPKIYFDHYMACLNKECVKNSSIYKGISVACLSKRCYLWALSIMEAYKNWKTKHQGNNKINRMLFVQLPGLKKEETIFHLLRQFRGGELSKTEFNSRLKEEKVILMPKLSQPSLLKKLSKIEKATKHNWSLIVTWKRLYKNTLLWNRNLFLVF